MIAAIGATGRAGGPWPEAPSFPLVILRLDRRIAASRGPIRMRSAPCT